MFFILSICQHWLQWCRQDLEMRISVLATGQDRGGTQEVGGIRDCRHFRCACSVPYAQENIEDSSCNSHPSKLILYSLPCDCQGLYPQRGLVLICPHSTAHWTQLSCHPHDSWEVKHYYEQTKKWKPINSSFDCGSKGTDTRFFSQTVCPSVKRGYQT